jgi:hypothetical protein
MKTASNNILVGLGAVVLLGCGGLGYLISQASGEYSTLRSEYQTEVGKYNRLRGLSLYPDQANLKKLEEQEAVAERAAETLRKKLEPMSIPLEEITPEQFMDKLRASVSLLTQKAADARVKLPDKFYLGFDKYQSQPPTKTAAAPLWRQLKALELVVSTLIDSKVESLNSIQRTSLPEEDGKPASASLVSKFPFEIEFTGDQGQFRKVLGDVVKNNKQFFITRSLSVKNPVDKPTPKASFDHGESPATEEGESSGKKEAPLKYIVGTEKLTVSLRLEMVVVANSFPK